MEGKEVYGGSALRAETCMGVYVYAWEVEGEVKGGWGREGRAWENCI